MWLAERTHNCNFNSLSTEVILPYVIDYLSAIRRRIGYCKVLQSSLINFHNELSGEETDGIYEKLFEIDSVKEIIENTKLTAENVKTNEAPFTNLEARLNDVEKFILEIE